MVLSAIFTSQDAERALIFINARGQGYPYEIAKFYGSNLRGIQKQLERLEFDGLLISQKIGRTRVYSFNPRYPFLYEVQQLLAKALEYYPPELREALLISRKRPRRAGKPQ